MNTEIVEEDTIPRFDQRCGHCGLLIGVPVDRQGETITCPECLYKFRAEMPKPAPKPAWPPRPERPEPVRPKFQKVRDRADSVFGVAILWFIVAGIALVVGVVNIIGESSPYAAFVTAGGFASLGITFCLWSTLIHIRAGIEESNHLARLKS